MNHFYLSIIISFFLIFIGIGLFILKNIENIINVVFKTPLNYIES